MEDIKYDIRYYENGNIKEICIWKNGFLDGLCSEYFEDGSIRNEYLYKDGYVIETLEEDFIFNEEFNIHDLL